MREFDYIILGGGCAGLSLAYELDIHQKLNDKTLAIVEPRTEYKRDLNMELVMDYTDIPYGSGRTSLILTKPSLVEPTATQIRQVIESVSPQNEPGIRKYFIAPPSESWTPKEGRYSFNISWIIFVVFYAVNFMYYLRSITRQTCNCSAKNSLHIFRYV